MRRRVSRNVVIFCNGSPPNARRSQDTPPPMLLHQRRNCRRFLFTGSRRQVSRRSTRRATRLIKRQPRCRHWRLRFFAIAIIFISISASYRIGRSAHFRRSSAAAASARMPANFLLMLAGFRRAVNFAADQRCIHVRKRNSRRLTFADSEISSLRSIYAQCSYARASRRLDIFRVDFTDDVQRFADFVLMLGLRCATSRRCAAG